MGSVGPSRSLRSTGSPIMAKILGSFEFSAKGSRGSKHPWDEWLDGQIRRLEAADFGGSIPKHIAHQAKLVATKRGLTVKVQNVDGGVVIQAFKDQVPAVPS